MTANQQGINTRSHLPSGLTLRALGIGLVLSLLVGAVGPYLSLYIQGANASSYFTSQKTGFASSRYNSSGRSLSTARTSYRSTQQSTGSFKSSSTGVRSSWGSRSGGSSVRSSSGGRSSGFRGFGGGQRIIGLDRWAG